jgi:lysozyme
MSVSNLRDMLLRDEGKVRHVYKDSLGFWTIAVGRLVDERKGGGLSDDEIDYLLDNDIRSKRGEVREALPWTEELDEAREAVIVAMAFQMGTEGLLKFVNTLAAVRYGKYEDAANGMLASLWAKQTPERAMRMARQMRTGEWQ